MSFPTNPTNGDIFNNYRYNSTTGAWTSSVDDEHISWGIGTNQVSASDIPIADTGTNYIAETIEAALTEAKVIIDAQKIQNDLHVASDGTDHSDVELNNDYRATDHIPLAQKNSNNGVATLDAGGKIPATQLPATVMEFKGNYNASTNTPTLTNGTASAGDVYLVSVAGTRNFGAGSITFIVGDWVVYSGTIWERSPNSSNVVSVNAQTGVVVLNLDNIENGTTYGRLTNTQITDFTDGDNSSLHYHATDRARSGHTGTQVVATISDFDTKAVTKTSVTGSANMPTGTTAQRDISPATGAMRHNTSFARAEEYDGANWNGLGGASGSGGDAVFYENDQTVDNDYSITVGKNASSTGPVAISAGVTVTIPSGSVWVVI